MATDNQSNKEEVYLFLQEQWVKKNNIGVGMFARIIRKPEPNELGWNNEWTSEMDELIGKTFPIISDNYENGIKLIIRHDSESPFKIIRSPFFVLEIIPDEDDEKKGEKIMKESENEDKFRVGDKVWHWKYGWGKIDQVIFSDDDVPYLVSFQNEILITEVSCLPLQSKDCLWCQENELFFEEIPIPESALRRPITLRPGDPVIVWDEYNSKYYISAFIRKSDDGNLFLCRSYNSETEVGWDNCIPYDRTLFGFDTVDEE